MLKKLIGLLKWLWGYDTVPLRPQDAPGRGQTHPADRADVATHLTLNGADPVLIRKILGQIRHLPAAEAWEAIERHEKMKGWRKGGRR